jgi:hypothetical protein
MKNERHMHTALKGHDERIMKMEKTTSETYVSMVE